MSLPKGGAGEAGEAGDIIDDLFLDDEQRAEARWLLAREHDPDAPPPSLEVAADYDELEDLLGNLPSSAPDEGWKDEVFRAIAAAQRSPPMPPPPTTWPWWRTPASRWVLTDAMAMTMAVLLLLQRAPMLDITIRHLSASRGAPGEVAVGDHLVVTARPRQAGDLRIYRSDGSLVARCPHGPACTTGYDGALTLEVTLDVTAKYHVILLDGLGEALPDGTMNVYLDAALSADARILTPPPIDVR
jgi:hypothetical protein